MARERKSAPRFDGSARQVENEMRGSKARKAMNRQKICLMYDFHNDGEFELFNLNLYREASAGLADFFPVFHVRDPNRPAPQIDDLILLDDSAIFDQIKHDKTPKRAVTPGNRDLKMLAATRRRPGYDFYISVEYDVVFLVDPRAAIEALVASVVTADLCASFFDRILTNGWVWWDSLMPPEGSSIDRKAIATGAFLPLVAYSGRFAAMAEARLAEGWRGHQEVLWPSLAALSGMTMLDFAASSPKITSNKQFGVKPLETVSASDSLFCHPVKNMKQFIALLGPTT
jgi:hypothetical protein